MVIKKISTEYFVAKQPFRREYFDLSIMMKSLSGFIERM